MIKRIQMGIGIEEGRAANKSTHFLSISQQVVSANITKIQLLQYLNHEY
jgi:hypothetical protein